MKIIISPAKKMEIDLDTAAPDGLPHFIKEAQHLASYLRGLDYQALKRLLACNDKLAGQSYEQYQRMDLHRCLSPALLSYDGIQYRYMAPSVFTSEQLAYVQQHLRILSGLYGLLKPLDGVTPYRLELQAKLKTPFCSSLYDFWGDAPCRLLTRGEDTVLNLASGEYSRLIHPHLAPSIRYITAVFGELDGDRVIEKGVYVKMARGEMVRYMAVHQIERVEDIQGFDGLGYRFCKARSDERTYVFLRDGKEIRPGR